MGRAIGARPQLTDCMPVCSLMESEVQLEKPLTPYRTDRARGQKEHQKRLMQKWQVLLSFFGPAAASGQ